jgi:putative membrane protein
MLLLALFACERGNNEPEPTTTAANSQPSAAARERPAVFPEAEAIGVLRSIGQAEIAVTRVALDVSESEAVLAYSRVVAADYRGITQLLDSLATAIGQAPAENALGAELRAAGDSIAGGLRTLPYGFNNTFIEEEVKAQRRVLLLLDTALVPSARNPELKNLLQALRPTIAAHLQRATQILADRRRAAAERGEPWQSGFDVAPPPVIEAPVVPEEAPEDTLPADTTRQR